MKATALLRNLLIVLIFALNVGCDQLSKSLVRERIDFAQEYSYVSGYLTLMRVENTGAFLSVGGEWSEPMRKAVLVGLPLVVLAFTAGVVMLRTDISRIATLGICFMVGGGLGNLYDRFMYGSVTDFVHIDLPIFNTGVFNMADVSITTGAVLIGLELAKNLKSTENTAG